MTGRDPQREPESETKEKPEILKTHEEFLDDNSPSIGKRDYERHKEVEEQKAREKSDRDAPSQPKTQPKHD